jgi:hypothetical protein
MVTGSFPGLEWPGRGVDHLPPSSVEERVKLYLYTPLWAFEAPYRVNFTFTFTFTYEWLFNMRFMYGHTLNILLLLIEVVGLTARARVCIRVCMYICTYLRACIRYACSLKVQRNFIHRIFVTLAETLLTLTRERNGELLSTNSYKADGLQEAIQQEVLSDSVQNLQALLRNFVRLHQTRYQIPISDKYLFFSYNNEYGITL